MTDHNDRLGKEITMDEVAIRPAPVSTAPTLASLLRDGCEGTYQAVEHFAYRNGHVVYLCAAAAIYHGAGMISGNNAVREDDGTETLAEISMRRRNSFQREVMTMLLAEPPTPPCGHPAGGFTSTEDLIVHLNDDHRWPRERVAMYLEEWMR